MVPSPVSFGGEWGGTSVGDPLLGDSVGESLYGDFLVDDIAGGDATDGEDLVWDDSSVEGPPSLVDRYGSDSSAVDSDEDSLAVDSVDRPPSLVDRYGSDSSAVDSDEDSLGFTFDGFVDGDDWDAPYGSSCVGPTAGSTAAPGRQPSIYDGSLPCVPLSPSVGTVSIASTSVVKPTVGTLATSGHAAAPLAGQHGGESGEADLAPPQPGIPPL